MGKFIKSLVKFEDQASFERWKITRKDMALIAVSMDLAKADEEFRSFIISQATI